MPPADAFVRSGKVRDLFAVDDERLLLVASDRLSAFDVVLPTPIRSLVGAGATYLWTDAANLLHLLDATTRASLSTRGAGVAARVRRHTHIPENGLSARRGTLRPRERHRSRWIVLQARRSS